MRIRTTGLTGILVAGLSSALPAAASATTVTVGSPLTASFSSEQMCQPICTQANTALPEPGAQVRSPVNGVIVRWRILDASGGPFKLRVLRPAGGDNYTGAGTSSPQTPTSLGVQVFPADLSIRAGDLIGLDNTDNTDNLGFAFPSGADAPFWAPQLADGATAAPTDEAGEEAAFNADVVAQPVISSVSPSSGPVSGGTPVVLQGRGFTGTTAVSFGGRAATSFDVGSDSQISAIAPAAAAAGPVDVTVTATGGQSPTSAADRFTYTPQCVVPKLKGKRLGKARKLLKAAHCKLRRVKKPKHHKGQLVVKTQSPRAGKALANGALVSVRLGRKPRHSHH